MKISPEKEERARQMIEEIRDVEKHLEEKILQIQTRLHEHRRRRDILQEYLTMYGCEHVVTGASGGPPNSCLESRGMRNDA